MNPETYRIDRAIHLISIDRYSEAEKELSLRLSEEPNDAYALALLGHCRVENGAVEEGIEILQQSLGIRPDDDYTYYLLAGAYMSARNGPASTEAIKQALVLNPGNADYIARYANTYIGQQNTTRALVEANRALAIDPENLTALAIRAIALFQLEKFNESEATVRTALALSPTNQFFHELLGKAKFHDGDVGSAFDSFHEALRLDPTKEDTKENLLTAVKARYWLYRKYLLYFSFRNDPVFTNEERGTADVFVTLIIMCLFLGAILEESVPIVLGVILLLTSLPLTIIFIAEPIVTLIVSFNRRWRYSLGRTDRRLLWVTATGLAVTFAGLISFYVPLIIFGACTVMLAGSRYENFTARSIRNLILVILFGIASWIPLFVSTADVTYLMMNIFGVAVLAFRWFTDAPTTLTSYWR